MSHPILFRRQTGAILVITLLFLVVLTLVALSAVNTGTMEERMARNSRDYNVALQAAEAALADARADLSGAATLSTRNPVIIQNVGFDTTCTNGLCTPAPSGSPAIWEVENNWTNRGVSYGTYTFAQQLPLVPSPGGVSQQPRYLIETLGASGSQWIYRITARGWGAGASTMVMLQEEILK